MDSDLTSLLVCLGGSARCIAAVRQDFGFQPRTGSLAETQSDEADAFLGQMKPNPVKAAIEVARVQMMAAADFAAGLELLLNDDRVVSAFAVARAGVECCGRAWELLDPGIDWKTRAALGMTERLSALGHSARLLKDLDPDMNHPETESNVADLLRRQEMIKEQAKSLQLAMGQGSDGTAFVASERTGFRRIFEGVLGADSDTPRFGKVMANYLSEPVHGSAGAVLGLSDVIARDVAEERSRVVLELSPQVATRLALALLIAFLQAASREVILHGWGASPWKAWHEHAYKTGYRAATTFDA